MSSRRRLRRAPRWVYRGGEVTNPREEAPVAFRPALAAALSAATAVALAQLAGCALSPFQMPTVRTAAQAPPSPLPSPSGPPISVVQCKRPPNCPS